MNGNIAPKSIVVEVADPIPQRGRRNPRMRHSECSGVLPGFVPLACNRRVPCEQGRSVRFKRKLVGSDKPVRRGRFDDLTEVRLADSTRRSGEPATWGSGQQKLNCSWATWTPFNGRSGLLYKEKTHQPWKQDSNE